jgi:hypothetical protein
MTRGAFPERDRAIVYARSDGRCAGCGRSSPLTVQHRRARGMGGTRRREVGEHPNGVALCGSGTTGCHGWAEANPRDAELLGWALDAGADPLVEPYRDRTYGWRRVLPDGGHAYVDEEELDRADERAAAWARYGAELRRSMAR